MPHQVRKCRVLGSKLIPAVNFVHGEKGSSTKWRYKTVLTAYDNPSGLIILYKSSMFKTSNDEHCSIIMHSSSASEEKMSPLLKGEPWITGVVQINFHQLTLQRLSIKPQKFPPKCTNNSPDHNINCGCCKTQLEYIRKVNIPRSIVYSRLPTTIMC